MAKKKLKIKNGVANIGVLSDALSKLMPNFETAASLSESYRYIDFCDPRTGRPTLAMEYLFGSRGLVRGRVTNLIARGSCGKSSFMYYMYGCAQRMPTGAWTAHAETEGAPAPADFIAGYGVDPTDLMVTSPRSFDDMTEWIDTLEAALRGPWGDGEINPATGRKVKSKFTDPLDPPDPETGEFKAPMLVGVDSISILGKDSEVLVDVADTSKDRRIGGLAKPVRDYFGLRLQRFSKRDMSIILANQETEKISTGFVPRGGSTVTCKAYEALFILSTYMLTMSGKRWVLDKPPYTQFGDIITMKTIKNKISTRNREIKMYLRFNHGFDMVATDINWLMTHPESPFVKDALKEKYGAITRYGGRYTCKLLQDAAFPSDVEFLEALYNNEDVMRSIREDLRIRGYGFSFETDYEFKEELDDLSEITEEADSEED